MKMMQIPPDFEKADIHGVLLIPANSNLRNLEIIKSLWRRYGQEIRWEF